MKLFQRLQSLWRWLFTKEPVPRKLTVYLDMQLTRAEWVDRPTNQLGDGSLSLKEFVVVYTLDLGWIVPLWHEEFRFSEDDARLLDRDLLLASCTRAVCRDFRWMLAQQSNRYPDSRDGEDAPSAEESPS